MPQINFVTITVYFPFINNHTVSYDKRISVSSTGVGDASTLGNLGSITNILSENHSDVLNDYINAGYNVTDNLVEGSTFTNNLYTSENNIEAYTYESLNIAIVNASLEEEASNRVVSVYLDKSKLETYLATLPTPITPSDTPLVSMVLVDDNNNRTTFNGPIINDFTITEDLQEKITQLTTLATNISNLQTRLTNITNILNTQNIEFTDNVSDVSSAGSKLYIQPQVYLKLTGYTTPDSAIPTIIRYLNLTPYVTGKYEFTGALNISCSLGLESDFDPSEWNISLGPDSLEGLIVNIDGANIDGTTEPIGDIHINGSTIYANGAIISNIVAFPDSNSSIVITIVSYTGSVATINIKFTK